MPNANPFLKLTTHTLTDAAEESGTALKRMCYAVRELATDDRHYNALIKKLMPEEIESVNALIKKISDADPEPELSIVPFTPAQRTLKAVASCQSINSSVASVEWPEININMELGTHEVDSLIKPLCFNRTCCWVNCEAPDL